MTTRTGTSGGSRSGHPSRTCRWSSVREVPMSPGVRLPDRLPHSDLFFDCADIESTYAELTARGVNFPLPPARQHFGWWALFEDNEGTRYALGQWESG